MSMLAPTLQAWFIDRPITQRKVSRHTIASYRDAVRLLLVFAQQKTGKDPSQLEFTDLDAPLIGAFLNHLEQDRGNSPRTRNARLAAIHSLFRYAAMRHPEHAASIARVIEIPSKRRRQTTISYLDRPELEALLATPDRTTWLGRRDHAMLLVAIQTGVRVSELVNLTMVRLDKHTATAARRCPTLQVKRITPHTLRHTNAMLLRAENVDLYTIALWLGHASTKSTEIYLHADNKLKQQAIDRAAPIGTPPGRYKPPDRLLAFLEGL